MPKQSSTTSAVPVAGGAVPALAEQRQPAAAVRAAELAHRAAGPAASRRPRPGRTASAAWSRSACGSTPRGSAVTVSSSASWASPHAGAQVHRQRVRALVRRIDGQVGRREVIGGGHRAEVEHTVQSGDPHTRGSGPASCAPCPRAHRTGRPGGCGDLVPAAVPRRPRVVHPHVRRRDLRRLVGRARHGGLVRPGFAVPFGARASSAACTAVAGAARPSWCGVRTARCTTCWSTSGPQSPTFGRHEAFLLDDNDVPSSLRAAGLAARLPGAAPTSPTSATASTARTIRPRTSAWPTTTPTWRSTGRWPVRCVSRARRRGGQLGARWSRQLR